MISSRLQRHRRPEPWHTFRVRARHRYLLPFYYLDWLGGWAAHALGKWSIFSLLEYVERLSILFAAIFYFAGSGDRQKQKHYQAWQVINTAQGKGGSGGRIEALRELNEDRVPLVGVDASGAYLQNLRLVGADLRRGDFHAADLRGADFRRSDLQACNLNSANLRGAEIGDANLSDANFDDADLNGARLSGSTLRGVSFERADLRSADLTSVHAWSDVGSVRLANVHGIRSAPEGFFTWALAHGAVDAADDHEWNRLLIQPRLNSCTR